MDGDRVSRGLHLHYPDWRVSYPAFQSHRHYLKLPGIRLSRWKMESAQWFSQWLSCSACCRCSARFQIGRLCCRLMFPAWLCGYWCCPQPSALSPLFPLPPSPLLTRLTVWLDSNPPVTSICSHCFSTYKVDTACLQISLTNIFETKGRPSCRSSSSWKLTVEYVLRNSPVPSQLTRLWRTRSTYEVLPPELGHPYLWLGLVSWCLKSFWGSADGGRWVCVLGGQSRGSRSLYRRAACWARRPGLA